MKQAKVIQAAGDLLCWLQSLSDEGRDAILRFIAAWPGADELTELFPNAGSLGWAEIKAVFDLYQAVDSSEDVRDAVDVLVNGADEDLAAALNLIPLAIASRGEGVAIAWKRKGQADGVAGLWTPGEKVWRYRSERQWEQTDRKTDEFHCCAWAAAEAALREQGLSPDEVEEVLRSAIMFHGRA